MRITAGILFVGALLVVASFTSAQPPDTDKGGKGFPRDKGGNAAPGNSDALVAQMMAFDKNKDGKLTKDEVTDARLHRLFERADANKDGVVTRDELAALFAKETAGGGPGGGPDGFPGPGGFLGGPGGFGPPGGPPRPGQVMPPFLREILGLTDDQRKQLDALQKEVDGRLDKILTDEQKKQIKELRERGPGGFGPPGFPGGGPPPGFEPPGSAPGPMSTRTPPKPRDVPYSAEAVRSAVEKSLPVLWKGIRGHTSERTCFTCHNHGVPLLAIATARDHGFDVPEKDLAGQVEFVTEYLESNRERFARGVGPGPPPSGGKVDTTGWALLALDAAGKKPDATTAVVVEYTLLEDRGRGYWQPTGNRPPSEHSTFTTNYLGVRSLQKYGRPEHKERIAGRVEAVREWLLKTPAKDTEDRVFRLLGLHAAGAAGAEVAKAAGDLLGTQREDGGWGQLDTMESDAYATGSALVALNWAGGLPPDDPVYRRGLRYLLGTQLDDGSWLVNSRSRPIQRYFESGFPHERDQFISSAATGWAATAFALACPTKK